MPRPPRVDYENALYHVTSRGKVEHAYDYMSRRVGKASYAWDTDHWSLDTERTFLYDGWAMIREQTDNQQTVATNYYIYGLDLSGTLQGAGTIGGLLAVVRNGEPYFPAYDANGNITEYTDMAGEIVAQYQYDPFGNVTAQSGSLSDAFAFRFSTKYTDDETGLVYYGYRFYHPELGRWINGDPIGEIGSPARLVDSTRAISANFHEDDLYHHDEYYVYDIKNLYLFVDNNPSGSFDYMGLRRWRRCPRGQVWTSNPGGTIPPADGCSAPGILPGPPDNPGWGLNADFETACNGHDYCYSDCDSSQKDCDKAFRQDLMEACAQLSGIQRTRCRNWARAYYRAVRTFGGGPYRNRQEKACHCACP